MSPSLLIALALGAELLVQPGTPSPGDVVLLSVDDVEHPPTGTLGQRALTFFPSSLGYTAVVGLSVDQEPGPLSITVSAQGPGGRIVLGGTLVVKPAAFRRRTLSVDPRFTSPSPQQIRRSQRDQRAFQKAFDQDWEGFLFDGDFESPRRDLAAAPFGDLRVFNGKQKSQHMGLDLDGDTGDPVTAANDGEVVMVRDCFGSGNTVLVHHGARIFTAYFHLSRFDVHEGDRVTRGQQLGLVGSTGRVTGPHLHFGVKVDGRWVNPQSLLALRFEPPVGSDRTPRNAIDRATPEAASPETQ